MIKKPAFFKLYVFNTIMIFISLIFFISCGDLFNAENKDEIGLTPRPAGTPIPTSAPTPYTSPAPTQAPTPEPPPLPTVTPEGMGSKTGDVWFNPYAQRIYLYDETEKNTYIEIHVNTGAQKLAAYGIYLLFESEQQIIEVDMSQGTNGVIPRDTGFVAAVNANDPGILKITGFDAGGKGPAEDLYLLVIYFKGIAFGMQEIIIDVDNLYDNANPPAPIDDDNDDNFENNGYKGIIQVV